VSCAAAPPEIKSLNLRRFFAAAEQYPFLILGCFSIGFLLHDPFYRNAYLVGED
jgi:hypothetical protein